MPAAVALSLLLCAPPAAAPRFVAVTPAGPRPPAALAEWPAGLVGLTRVGVPRPAWPAGPQLILTSGDRLAGRVVGGDAKAIRFRPDFAAAGEDPWPVPLTAVAAVWVAPPPTDAPADPADYPWLVAKQDAVLTRTGDAVAGVVAAFTADPPGVRVKPPGQPATTLLLGDVTAVALDPSLARPRKPAGVTARVVLTDGSRVTVTRPAVAAGTLTGTAPAGGRLRVPLTAVAAVDVTGGDAVYLSDLTPVESEVAGFTGLAWPWRRDRTAAGGSLRLAGPAGVATFDKGLGTHARTRLAFDLPAGATAFDATVGLDPATGRRGTPDVRVLLDGKPADVPGLASLTAATAVPVWLPTAGAKRLTLVVDYGRAGGVQAAVNWGQARVVTGGAR